MGLALLSFGIGVFQTEWFVTKLEHPSHDKVLKSMYEDEAVQKKRAEQYVPPPGKTHKRGIIIHPNFYPIAQQMLAKARAELLDDQALQDAIRKDFDRSFHDVNAIVFPAWETNHHKVVFGFTDFGLEAARDASDQLFAAGFTVRDRLNQGAATEDGIPRVGINQEAFDDHDTLKLTLFHELLHAMNVPKSEPPWFTLMQNDLVYCDEYRGYLTRYGFKYNRERNIRMAIALPLGAFVFLLGRHLWWVLIRDLEVVRRLLRRRTTEG